jgi:hypothetical protein
MNRSITFVGAVTLFSATLAVSPRPSHAHFPWLATDDDGRALLFFGESPADREYHTPDAVAEAKVLHRTTEREPMIIDLPPVEEAGFIGRRSETPLNGGGVLESAIHYGVYHGMLLDYHAKHYRDGDAAAWEKLGPSKLLKLDAAPRNTDDGVELLVRWEGKPAEEVEVTLIDADGVPTETTTNADGVAKFDAPEAGLIGFLIARTDNAAEGEIDGEKYMSAAAYGTVTVRYGERSAKAQAALTPLPEPLASFGAAVCDGWLYVYGGHIGEEHAHSRDNLSAHFRRIHLAAGADGVWEELPMQTPLQGLPLVAHDGKLYRVGGLSMRNADDEAEDMNSVPEFASYDPATGHWTAFAPLPEPRSSHDAVVIGDKLYVVGGWTLDGDAPGQWLGTAWAFDFAKPASGWGALASPPFKRRALAVAEWNGNLVAVGGMNDDNKTSSRVDALDLATGDWRRLPELPRSDSHMAGFGASAWNLGGNLLVSAADGVVHQLADDGSRWERVGMLNTGRFFHRLMPGRGSTLLAVAGACPEEGHVASIEEFRPGNKN